MTIAAANAIRFMVFYWQCSLYFRCCVCVSFCCLSVYVMLFFFFTFVLRYVVSFHAGHVACVRAIVVGHGVDIDDDYWA